MTPHLEAAVVPAQTTPDILPARPRRAGPLGFAGRHPAITAGLVILSVLLIAAVLAPYLHTHDPAAVNPVRRNRPPSEAAWFGTDALGRDLYSRVIYGTRVSLAVGITVSSLSSAAGLLIGLVAGSVRRLDTPIMRVMDGVMAMPSILLAIGLMALLGASLANVVVALTAAEIPRCARLVRSVALSAREQPYVDAAVASGTRRPAIVLRHILPNTLSPLIVQATYACAGAMIAESLLSFIGAGTPPTTPSWGNIMAEARALWQVKPYMIFFPAAFLSGTVLAVNLIGDGLRDALDPRSSGRR